MRIALFCHSLVSDWNHGNAHFLRGVCTELLRRSHRLQVYEPSNAWSLQNLVAEYGQAPVERFHAAYPQLRSTRYDPADFDVDAELDGCDLAIVHEWSDHELVSRIGRHHSRNGGYKLLFHDTHHRTVTAPESMAAYDLSGYDGVLAFGRVIRDLYLKNGWAERAWTWHEAADINLFRPRSSLAAQGDLVWIGNWGDEERTQELQEFLLEPAKKLQLKTRVFGVRYPDTARQALAEAGIEYAGWLPNFEVPRAFSDYRLTIHVPRRPYVSSLPGIPTIRVFEALACGIPLICSPWNDIEDLFEAGDFLVARTGAEMTDLIRTVLSDGKLARELADSGRQTIMRRHTCAHRVDQLLDIYSELTGQQRENSQECKRD